MKNATLKPWSGIVTVALSAALVVRGASPAKPDVLVPPRGGGPVKVPPIELRAPEDVTLPARFVRADADGSGTVDLSDALAMLSDLFLGSSDLACLDAADANDDGAVTVSDPIQTLGFLFLGGSELPLPYPECGVDTTADVLGCSASPSCAPTLTTSLFQITPVDGGFLLDLPQPIVRAMPDGAAVEVDSTSPRSASASGTLHKISTSTVFLETSSAALGRAAGSKLTLRAEARIVSPPLGYTCGDFACICSGDEHCAAMFQAGVCGVEGVCAQDVFGNEWCICAR